MNHSDDISHDDNVNDSDDAPYTIYKRPKHDTKPIGSSLKPHQYEISKVHPSSKVPIPDLKLFENMKVLKDRECRKTADDEKEQIENEDNLQIITCPAMKRLVSVLNYYNALMLSGPDGLDEIATSKFIDFCDRHYGTKWILEDHIHCIAVHHDRDSMDKMAAALKWKCFDDLNRCGMTTRHYRDRSKRTAVHFYVDLMDSLHFNVLHLVDVGLRVDVDTNTVDEPMGNNLVDKTMLKMVRAIRLKREQCFFDRLDDTSKNSKFSLCSVNAKGTLSKRVTLDRVLRDLWKHTKNDMVTKRVHRLWIDEQYDTETMNDDMRIYLESKECNVLSILNGDNVAFAVLRRVLRYYRLMASSFSTGIWWAYWPWYRTQTMESILKLSYDSGDWSNIDFGGHSMKDLCVYPRFANLKQEVLESGLVSPRAMNRIMAKADRYFNSSRCKQMKCQQYRGTTYFFGINEGTSVTKQHVLSILLYTDSSAYCTALSETFRALEDGETIEETNSRNSHYYWTSRYLREMIYCFGDDQHYLSRTYYTGLSFEMKIPQFAIGLIGPTSTSMAKEVALRFAGEEGMVLVLKDGGEMTPYHFDASWLSAYPEEQERVFCGSIQRQPLSTIILVNSAKNYKVAMSAYSKFDGIFSACSETMANVSDDEFDIIMESLRWIKGGDDAVEHQGLDQYILETFHSFIIHKTTLSFLLNELWYAKDSKLKNMVINTMWDEGHEWKSRTETESEDVNLLKPFVFELFPNVNSISIWSPCYPFDLVSFLRILQRADLPEQLKLITVMGTRSIGDYFSEKVNEEYKKANMEASLNDQLPEHWVLSINL